MGEGAAFFKRIMEELIRLSLARFSEIRLTILFGSLATGRRRQDSDIDLAVDMGQPMTADIKTGLVGELVKRIGRPVDL